MGIQDKGEELGYLLIYCQKCGWQGWTDTGVCGGCDAFDRLDEQDADTDNQQETDMTTTTLTLTVRVTNTTLDDMREHIRNLNLISVLEGTFVECVEQSATVTDITISDDSKPRTFVSKLAE